MNKSNKSFFLIIIIVTMYINIFLILKSFLFCRLNDTLILAFYVSIPLIILLIIYFLCNKHKSIKLNINYSFFIFSFLFFVSITLYYICYAFVFIYDFNIIIVSLLVIFSIIFLFISFYKNFEINRNALQYIPISLIYIIAQFLLIVFINFLFYDTIKVSNPNRYEFVKYHFYSSSELTSFPKEIPKNALNVSLKYIEHKEISSYQKSFRLEFDINVSKDKVQHFEYYESNK